MLDQLPTKEEELERKAMNELSRILHLYESGRVSHREMCLMLDTLWACFSGLADESWREMIEEMRRLPADSNWTHIGIHPDKQLLVHVRRDEETLSATFFKSGKLAKKINNDFSLEVNSSKLTSDKHNALIADLAVKGFTWL